MRIELSELSKDELVRLCNVILKTLKLSRLLDIEFEILFRFLCNPESDVFIKDMSSLSLNEKRRQIKLLGLRK